MPDDSDGTQMQEIDADKQGQSEVQSNGVVYVGRDLAGETVQWWAEVVDDGGDGDDS